jgi:hypothetical protein
MALPAPYRRIAAACLAYLVLLSLLIANTCEWMPYEPLRGLIEQRNETEHSQRRLSEVNYVSYKGPLVHTLDTSIHSHTHCIGDTFTKEAYRYRTCLIRNLCLDVATTEFFVIPSASELRLLEWQKAHFADDARITISSLSSVPLSLGIGKNSKGTVEPIEWVPRHGKLDANKGYHMIPSDHVWLPQYPNTNDHSSIWDFMFPQYMALELFSVQDKAPFVTVLDYPAAYTCTSTKCSAEAVSNTVNYKRKYESTLKGVKSSAWVSSMDKLRQDLRDTQSTVVCASQAVVGVPLQFDVANLPFAPTREGSYPTFLTGRGFWVDNYRQHMLQQLGLSDGSADSAVMQPIRAKVQWNKDPDSTISSLGPTIYKRLSSDNNYDVKSLELDDTEVTASTFREQVRMVMRTRLLVVASCNHQSSWLATFLPKGSTLMLACREKEYIESQWFWHKQRGTIRVYDYTTIDRSDIALATTKVYELIQKLMNEDYEVA